MMKPLLRRALPMRRTNGSELTRFSIVATAPSRIVSFMLAPPDLAAMARYARASIGDDGRAWMLGAPNMWECRDFFAMVRPVEPIAMAPGVVVHLDLVGLVGGVDGRVYALALVDE
jgi:hypothetical protein